MEWLIALCLLTPLSCIIAAPLSALAAAHEHRRRWGVIRTPLPAVQKPAGPYRAGALQAARPRPIPWLVLGAAALGHLWAWLTALLLAPVGLLLSAYCFAWPPGDSLAFRAVALVGILLAVHGLGLALRLHRAGRSLVRVEACAPDLSVSAGIWSCAHHLALWVVFDLIQLAAPMPPLLYLAPAAAGIIHGVMLILAGCQTGRIYDRMSDTERQALRR